MPTPTEWIVYIVSTIIALAICAIITRSAIHFYHFRYTQAIQKRYPFLVILITICFVLYIGFFYIFYKLAFLYGTVEFEIDEYDHSNTLGNIFFITSMFFYAFSIHGIVVLILARLWIIYFEIKWSVQSENSQWMEHINHESVSLFWFIKHRKDYGSYKNIYTFITIYYIIEAIFIFSLMINNQHLARSVDLFLLIIEMSTATLIWWKIPKIHDAFGIKEETQYFLRLAMVAIIIYILWTVQIMLFGYIYIASIIFGILLEIVTGSAALILTSYIFRAKFKHLFNGNERPNKQQFECKLCDTLSKKELIAAFFKHLSHEFSVELLLAYIEFTQFRALMLNDSQFMNNIEHDQLQNDEFYHVVLCEDLPKSQIVFGSNHNVSNNTSRYLYIAHDLYNKYVHYGAEFEVNISYGCHSAIKTFITLNGLNENDINQSSLFTLFEDARHILLLLMQSSHSRFVRSTYYKSIAESIQIQMEPTKPSRSHHEVIQTDDIENDGFIAIQNIQEISDNHENSFDDSGTNANELKKSLINERYENNALVRLYQSKSHPVQKKETSTKLHLKQTHSD